MSIPPVSLHVGHGPALPASAPEPVLMAGGRRPIKLSNEERFLPAAEQIDRLRRAGFVEVGDFSLKLDPGYYGVSIEALHRVINAYTQVLGQGGPVDRAMLDGLLTPLLEQAKQSAPVLAEMNWDLPQGFKNAVRSDAVHVEAVYTGFERRADEQGPYFQANARVFIQKH